LLIIGPGKFFLREKISAEISCSVQTVQYVPLLTWLDLTYILMSCVSEIKGVMELSKKMRLKLGATSEPVKSTEKPSAVPVKEEPAKPAEKPPAVPVKEEPVKPAEKPAAGPVKDEPAKPLEKPSIERVKNEHAKPLEKPSAEPVKDEPVKPLEKPSAEPMKDEPVKPTEPAPAGENNQVPGVGQTTISPNNAGVDSAVKNDNSDAQQ